VRSVGCVRDTGAAVVVARLLLESEIKKVAEFLGRWRVVDGV